MTSGNPVCDWLSMRQNMPVTEKWAYLDHAAVSPLPEPTRQALLTFVSQATLDGDTVWSQWAQEVERLRAVLARLIGSQQAEIAIIPNTTTGISLVAEGFPWRDGDNVVTVSGEFPSNRFPWMHLQSRGVEVRTVTSGPIVDLDKIRQACDHRTRLVSVSWIGYATGYRVDVAQLSDLVHNAGALLFLDAIQGAGVFPLDVKRDGVDFAAADGHKWLLGPEGAGFLYVDEKHLEQLRPLMIGWNSVVNRYDFDDSQMTFRPEAARYEGGSQNMLGIHGLSASVQFLQRFGSGPDSTRVADRVLALGQMAVERLQQAGAKIVTSRPAGHESGIIVFEVPGVDPQAVRNRCLAANVALCCRGGGLRISIHAYNDESDIDRLIDVLP